MLFSRIRHKKPRRKSVSSSCSTAGAESQKVAPCNFAKWGVGEATRSLKAIHLRSKGPGMQSAVTMRQGTCHQLPMCQRCRNKINRSPSKSQTAAHPTRKCHRLCSPIPGLHQPQPNRVTYPSHLHRKLYCLFQKTRTWNKWQKMQPEQTSAKKCREENANKQKPVKKWGKQCNRKNQANEDATHIPHSMQMSKKLCIWHTQGRCKKHVTVRGQFSYLLHLCFSEPRSQKTCKPRGGTCKKNKRQKHWTIMQ